jgi:glycosyltransferase involved in cell wall biosynthesis
VLTLHDYQLLCPNDGLLLTVPEGARCAGPAPDRCRACFPDQTAARHALRRAHLLALVDGVDRFVAPSRFLRDRLVAWGIAPVRIDVLPNAVAAVAASAPADRPVRNRFAFFGNLLPHKGVLTLLDAAARLAAENAPLDLVLHGGLRHAAPAFREAVAAGLAAARPLARTPGLIRARTSPRSWPRRTGSWCPPCGGRTRPSSSWRRGRRAAR